MKGHALRVWDYKRQTNSTSLTPKQRKRAQKKLGHFLAKRDVISIRVAGK